jgi:hypothetical protein
MKERKNMPRWESKQVTLPVFDEALLSMSEEMTPDEEIKRPRHQIEIKGGRSRGSGPHKRMFAAGRIRMNCNDKR